MSILKEFLTEIKNFIKQNWWILITFVVCIIVIYKTNTWNIYEIMTIFLFHFTWDIFAMMMWNYYFKWDTKRWSLFQILSLLVFFWISIYSLIFNWKVNYLASQLIFIFSWVKSYFYDIKKKNYKILSYKVSIFIWIVLFSTLIYTKLISNYLEILQMTWFIIFWVFLTIDKEKIRYFWLLTWLFFMFLASWLVVYESFLIWNIKWIDVSYTLLPFTVFIFYLKSISKYL